MSCRELERCWKNTKAEFSVFPQIGALQRPLVSIATLTFNGGLQFPWGVCFCGSTTTRKPTL